MRAAAGLDQRARRFKSILHGRLLQRQASLSRAFLRCCRTLLRSAACSPAIHLRKALAALEAELTLGDQPFQIGRRTGPVIDIGQNGLVDGERQVGADQIGIFQGPQHRQPPAERRLDDLVDRLGVADAALDQRDRLAPQRMLQAVADEAGHVLLHMRRHFAGVGVQLHGEVDRRRRRSIRCR
jgi:hypothetical protein